MSPSDTPDPSGTPKPSGGGGLGNIDDVQGHPGKGNPPGPSTKPSGEEPAQPGSDPTRTPQSRTEPGPEAEAERQPT